MPAAWFIVPLVDTVDTGPRKGTTLRRPEAVYSRLPAIRAAGGRAEWSETGGRRVLAKVQATTAILTAIAGDAGVRRFPVLDLTTNLGGLTAAQRTTLRTWAQECGFTAAELGAALPANLAGVTLDDLLELLGGKGHGRVSRIFDRVGDTTPKAPR